MCGTKLGPSTSYQNLSTGGDVSGTVYQAGRDIHFGGATEDEVAVYEPKWSWKSPLTQAVLTWASVVLGVLGVLAGWRGFAPWFKSFGHGLPTEIPALGWIISLFVLLFLLVVTISLGRIAKHRTQHFSSWAFLPSITGWGGRIGLAKLQGDCPKCGGKLIFYDKPVEWISDVQSGRRKVTRRAAAAECTRNSDHWWTVDRTDGE